MKNNLGTVSNKHGVHTSQKAHYNRKDILKISQAAPKRARIVPSAGKLAGVGELTATHVGP